MAPGPDEAAPAGSIGDDTLGSRRPKRNTGPRAFREDARTPALPSLPLQTSLLPSNDLPALRRTSPPGEILTADALAALTAHLSDYICCHTPVFDDDGEIVDGSLVWWNDTYARARVHAVRVGQSMMETYFEPQGALEMLRAAWRDGRAHQLFEISPAAQDRYRMLDDIVRMDIVWLRAGSVVMEIGTDHSRVTALEVLLHEQELAIREALQQRLRDHDRERIARDLHDSVIQQLFVTILELKAAEGRDGETQTAAIRQAVATIDATIADLRATIFALQHHVAATLEDELCGVIASFRSAPFSVELHYTLGVDLPDDLAEDVRLVVLEALANAARHAQAHHVTVTVGLDGPTLDVSVVDDGVGPPAETSRMSGLANLNERARAHGGWCWLRPAAGGRGSHLRWSVPLPI
jgi:signal transduction histidine kinase